MNTPNYFGYTESDAKIKARLARQDAIDHILRTVTEDDMDALHELMIICDTDPAHILNTQDPVWDTQALTAAVYGQADLMSRDEQIPLEHMGRKFSGSDYEPAWMSEAVAQHADWLDEKQTEQEAIGSKAWFDKIDEIEW